MNNKRNIKVRATNDAKYNDTPTILLKGKYLENLGYSINTPLEVTILDDKIIIEKVSPTTN